MKAEALVSKSEANDLRPIEAILRRTLTGSACEVYLFGSRATGDHSPAADFDIAILAPDDVSRQLSLARELLEESTIPFKIDLVDLRFASPALRKAVLQQGRLLWKN